MPRRRRPHRKRSELTEEQVAWLSSDDDAAGILPYVEYPETLKRFWHEHSEHFIAQHVKEYPGTRPLRWWEYDAPEPRQRLGGIGNTQHDKMATEPWYILGLPVSWIEPWMVDYYEGRVGVAPDPKDPPIFESEAAYLKRHGLLLDGELKRLNRTDFEPEAII